jgi:hypothetical protein
VPRTVWKDGSPSQAIPLSWKYPQAASRPSRSRLWRKPAAYQFRRRFGGGRRPVWRDSVAVNLRDLPQLLAIRTHGEELDTCVCLALKSNPPILAEEMRRGPVWARTEFLALTDESTHSTILNLMLSCEMDLLTPLPCFRSVVTDHQEPFPK